MPNYPLKMLLGSCPTFKVANLDAALATYTRHHSGGAKEQRVRSVNQARDSQIHRVKSQAQNDGRQCARPNPSYIAVAPIPYSPEPAPSLGFEEFRNHTCPTCLTWEIGQKRHIYKLLVEVGDFGLGAREGRMRTHWTQEL
jgi:hypothetical protein